MDGIAYGLMQWRDSERKTLLGKVASDMRLSYYDINAQFACMREESENNYKSAWNKLKTCADYKTAAQVVQNDIEQCAADSLAKRIEYAGMIYNAMDY